MIQRIFLITLLTLLSCGMALYGQASQQEERQDIFTHISSQTDGGVVTISQPNWVRGLVGKTFYQKSRSTWGYRIQIYTGNRSNSKNEAYNRAIQVRNAIPEYRCYINYQSPFWKVTMGDYTSREEASKAMLQLKQLLPSVAKEAYIIREKIRNR